MYVLRTTLTGWGSKNDARSIKVVVTKGDEKDSFDVPRITLRKASKLPKKILKELAPGALLFVNNVKPAALAEVFRYLYDGKLCKQKLRDGHCYDGVEEIHLNICVLAGRWDMMELFNDWLYDVDIGFDYNSLSRKHLIARTNELYFDMTAPPNLR